ncbi:hypothetical protein CRM95_21905 [Burkholderia gladioli]|nr:hypothetical protein CRM95_21905 [Burkholderia gladioli]TWC61315.1 hypothetical protein FB600_12578 [Burkholderia sp. SJZ089]TWC97328.1 hypothetical protein FB601_1255 [Burkholderia sp. SJZ091]
MIASQNILDALCSSDLTSLLVTWQQVRFQFVIDSIRAVYLACAHVTISARISFRAQPELPGMPASSVVVGAIG